MKRRKFIEKVGQAAIVASLPIPLPKSSPEPLFAFREVSGHYSINPEWANAPWEIEFSTSSAITAFEKSTIPWPLRFNSYEDGVEFLKSIKPEDSRFIPEIVSVKPDDY